MVRKSTVGMGSSLLLPLVSVVLVGGHLTAALLGMYTSAPKLTLIRPSPDAAGSGAMVIEARADDGPSGSGVRRVEYQLDSLTGAWTPLALDADSSSYKGTWDTRSVTEGNHLLYVRATDNAGNPRTLSMTVRVERDEPTRSPVLGSGGKDARASR